jgi:hypothetical protein
VVLRDHPLFFYVSLVFCKLIGIGENDVTSVINCMLSASYVINKMDFVHLLTSPLGSGVKN